MLSVNKNSAMLSYQDNQALHVPSLNSKHILIKYPLGILFKYYDVYLLY